MYCQNAAKLWQNYRAANSDAQCARFRFLKYSSGYDSIWLLTGWVAARARSPSSTGVAKCWWLAALASWARYWSRNCCAPARTWRGCTCSCGPNEDKTLAGGWRTSSTPQLVCFNTLHRNKNLFVFLLNVNTNTPKIYFLINKGLPLNVQSSEENPKSKC